VLFETGRCYHDTQKWYLKILLVMPDHLHMLVGIPGDANLSNLVRDFKRITPKMARIPIGSEIFSIIDCGTMKVRQKNLNTSAGTRCGQV
jgi:REP element-mobilizing transposase RayT